FVAGIIASSGNQSPTVTNASGSIMPATNGQFRGIAGAAPVIGIFSISSSQSDTYLQETAAGIGRPTLTNGVPGRVFISNNSWNESGAATYDIAAASYDAAVRDSLPRVPGSSPILYVFAAGNQGGGSDD